MKKAVKPNEHGTTVGSNELALALVRKMVAYEQSIDQKTEKSKAELRHLAFLRALRDAGFHGLN